MKYKRLHPALVIGSFSLIAASAAVDLPHLFGHSRKPETRSSASAQTTPPAIPQQSPTEPIGTSRNGIFLSYPHDGSTIDAPSTWLGGAVPPGSTLTVNGQPVHVNSAGFFAHVVPLKEGSNSFDLVLNGNPANNFQLALQRPVPPPPAPAEPAQILKNSIHPQAGLGLEPGDLVNFSLRGSPGSAVTVKVGQRLVPLQPVNGSHVNLGRATTYGVTFQKNSAANSDLYTGFYRVTADDHWQNETAQFTLAKNGTTVTDTASGRLTVVDQPFVTTTAHDDTIVRVGPGAGRTTPLAEGVRVLIDGWVGDSYRCEMAAGKHLWIESKDLSPQHEAGIPPAANVRTINIQNEGADGARIVVPLDQRLPYEVKQDITAGNRLQLKIYGATSDTDWITEPSTPDKAVAANGNAQPQPPKQGRAYPRPADRSKNPVGYVVWQQIADRVYQVTANLNERQQWGFWVGYENSDLVLHIKGAPNVALSPRSLKGLRVCVDPGHGGMETGAIGLSGTKEATINLGIGKRLQRLLQQQGADVIMTRDSDVDVSLGDRVKLAVDKKADLLVSIHNNSLPDGRDPLREHGTSSYYYQPQSLALAKNIRQGVVHDLGSVDFHTRWQNLALCRPSQMPAQLVEVGFMNNPDEYAQLLTAGGQEEAARGIAAGIHEFLAQSFGQAPKPVPHRASARRASASHR